MTVASSAPFAGQPVRTLGLPPSAASRSACRRRIQALAGNRVTAVIVTQTGAAVSQLHPGFGT